MRFIITSAAVLVMVVVSLKTYDCHAQQIFVPAKGNTWIVNNTLDKIDHKGIHQWQDPKSELGTFFKVNAYGFVNISIVGSVADGKSKLRFTLNEQSFAIEITNTKQIP